ncbi:hypothetical protein SAMN06265222_101222 [Neorhodopirellula lusitana]|uniref:Uncharacterized protein n=1 Tax=Neorhodopirellula lusitana TaxID=445327 RepID=A0ABY1PQR9_9BACT|nr:hypothetical protein [Neorhodopirellula lusitana]SMP38953.1 hypothetical protein SAMN06265222_101222 [Neorhodopirellula lusitana]
MYAPDTQIELTYPESTQVESRTTFRRRRVQIREVRDLISHPLTPEEYLRRPLTHRSRYLLTAFDMDTSQWRQFYLGSSKEHASDGRLRIALYKPGEERPSKIISRSFEPTRRDRIALARTLKAIKEKSHNGYELRVIPDEPLTAPAKPF